MAENAGTQPHIDPIPDVTPIGVVRSPVKEPKQMPRGGVEARIELDPRYTDGLLRIEEHSHLWILCWFHQAGRDALQTRPANIDPDAPVYGVFGLRAFRRPNPIGLSLVELQSVNGNVLHVRGLDAIDGTPVLDIKSYFERDCVFSPRAPVLRPASREDRWGAMARLALQHHREECTDLSLGVRMALIAEERLGKLTDPDLKVNVRGSGCLADTIQGLTRARFSNPPRFSFEDHSGAASTTWSTPDASVSIVARSTQADWGLSTARDEDLFEIT